MTRKVISQLLLVVTVLFFFNSCRTDETMQEEKRTEREKIEAFIRFESNLITQKSTQKNNSEYISYHKPFKEIIQAFMNKNPAFAQKFQKEVGDIYFDLRSLTYGETSKVIVYPIMKDDKVNAFIIGVINPQRDWVNFTVAKDDTPEVQRIISKFQNFYNSASVTSRGGREEEQPIEEVVIIVDSPGPVTFPYVDHNGFGGGMSGGGPEFSGGGSGSSNHSQNQSNQNLCERSKNMLQKDDVKSKIKELKDHAPKGGEIGVKFKVDGTPSETITGGAHSVNFGDKTGYAGGYHNHTTSGIPMLSPPDIDQLLGFARAQPTHDALNVKNAYMGMVAPNGMHYVAIFDGNYQDALKNFSQQEIDNQIADYIKIESELTDIGRSGNTYINSNGTINNLGVEKLFFETLRNMGLEGKVRLQRIENNDTVIKNIDLDGNNTPTPTTC
ncbi:hypothetical protein BBH99_16510 [Chryseobacterium contaminans]|uniref:Uncharacterized protein n=1 Tax=Chryseobacterium contaminans TaxID=1423959 RepID=A0A1M7E3S0_9FLAO|nr:hypothetical protein [Chryseobacterium contaminans]OCA80191.1 hypothetical protein BBH99_16510 [Chryseobacterium contaminans]SHL86343.1 hypothetical protein SAMN05444407_1077 [Chryseobacterium contaminans]